MNPVWLVVEDDPVIRSILKMLLTLWEVDSLVFEDGHQVWAWLDRVEHGDDGLVLPEVALLDIRLPGHLGHDIGRRMRSMSATSGIPLIMMTAYHLGKEDRQAIEDAARPEQIIAKPFPAPDDLRALIEHTIEISTPKQKTHPHFRFAAARLA